MHILLRKLACTLWKSVFFLTVVEQILNQGAKFYSWRRITFVLLIWEPFGKELLNLACLLKVSIFQDSLFFEVQHLLQQIIGLKCKSEKLKVLRDILKFQWLPVKDSKACVSASKGKHINLNLKMIHLSFWINFVNLIKLNQIKLFKSWAIGT